jgi:hypothetical protein
MRPSQTFCIQNSKFKIQEGAAAALQGAKKFKIQDSKGVGACADLNHC